MSQNEEVIKKDVPRFIPLLAGGSSGVITRFICHPLDVVKIRFQLQVEPIIKDSVESKYKSIHQAVRLIIQEEGLAALWKGHVPAQLLSATYGVVQFGTYDALIRKAKQHKQFDDNKSKIEFVCGFSAGCVASIMSFPFDIVRTRLIVQGKNKVYKNAVHGLIHILRHEGFRGWFKGLTPTLIQIGPVTGIQFVCYNFYKRLFKQFEIKNDIHSKWLSVSETALAGSLAGFTSKICTYPLDLSRKRLQFQGFQEARKGFGKNFVCSSLINCFTETVRMESPLGLYKGLIPSLMKSSIVNALIFTIYEETYNLLVSLQKVNR